MTLQIDLPDALGTQARELAAREQITVDALIASALVARIKHTPVRATIAERAARVDWQKVDAILARVAAAPTIPGHEV